jgi:uncharacterized protein (TIGR02421 family)
MDKIPQEIIERACRSLANGNGIRRRLPYGGIIHIDRPLPFLCVVRFPENLGEINAVDRLIISEASYLFCSDKHTDDLAGLLKNIVKILSDKFGAFLIIEFLTAPINMRKKNDPEFRITGTIKNQPSVIKTLENGLTNIHSLGKPSRVEVRSQKYYESENLKPLLSLEEKNKLSCLELKLEIKPFYINRSTKQLYPLLFRSLRTELSKVLKKTFFDFVRVQTNHNPVNFQVLGRRRVVRAVKYIDSELVEINDQYRFLLLITPTNANEAWVEFKKNKFEKVPVFHYRLMPVDPELLKRRLYNIPIEKVEDPTLGFLFRDKRFEIDKELTMLSQRNSKDFLYSSIQLFGGVNEQLLKTAADILNNFPVGTNEDKEDFENTDGRIELINAEEFSIRALEEIRYLKAQYSGVREDIEIRKDIVGILVSKGKLLISDKFKVSKQRVDALIQHEVGTHILTYYNGKAQPLKLLFSGAAGYEQLQEGLAVLAEYLAGGLTESRLRTLAARVKAVDFIIEGATFIDTFRMLTNEHNFEPQLAFTVTMRVYRGGGLTKDAVYLKGVLSLIRYLGKGKKLEPLLIGKIRQDYIPIINELIYRKVLKPIAIVPRYLKEKSYLKRLDLVKGGTNILNLIER